MKLLTSVRIAVPPQRSARVLVAAVLAFVASLSLVAAPASADLQDRQESIADRQEAVRAKLAALGERQEQLVGRIEMFDGRRAEVESQVAALDDRIQRLSGRIEDLEGKLTAAQQEISRLTAELQQILADLAARREVFADRAVATYKAGPAAYIDGLLASESFGDLLDRYEYYESGLAADTALIEEIRVLRDGVESRRDLVEQKQAEIAAAKLDLEGDRQEVARARSLRSDALAALDMVLSQKRSVLAEVESSKRHYLEMQARLQQESDQIAQLLAP